MTNEESDHGDQSEDDDEIEEANEFALRHNGNTSSLHPATTYLSLARLRCGSSLNL